MTGDSDKLCVIYTYICVKGTVWSVRWLAKTSGWEVHWLVRWFNIQLGLEW